MAKYCNEDFSHYGKGYVKFPVNRRLSDAYWKVVRDLVNPVEHPKDDPTYGSIKNKIAKSKKNIEEYFLKNGNLDKLRVKGIGEKTRKILSDIMTVGTEKARQNFWEKK